jgi:hypothetical protein
MQSAAKEYLANIKNNIQKTKKQIAEQLPTHQDIPLCAFWLILFLINISKDNLLLL